MRSRGLFGGWLAVLALTLGACSAALPVPTAADVARVQTALPATDVSLAALTEGRRLYLGRCSACHRPFQPSELTRERWAKAVPEMRERARFDEAQAARVLQYLTAFAAP